jgi:hypothetical protein
MSSSAVRALAASLLIAVSFPARASERAPRSVDPRLGPPFRHVVAGAAARLESAPCSAVLGSFLDGGTGLTLAEALRETGLTAPEFLLGLTYYGAPDRARCRDERLLAFTSPGSRVVLVCPANFARVARKEPGLAANVLIHESLHALGLADDFPSSVEITRTVEKACGR